MAENNEKHISEFMLSEYNHISSAHFEVAKQVTSFFRYYLLIMSAPAFLIFYFDKEPQKIDRLLYGDITSINYFIFWLLIIISIIGFFICLYIINKKFTGILYAQTVNGVRNYFVKNATTDVSAFLVLPTVLNKPKYFQFTSLFLIFPFAIINSSLISFAFWIINYNCACKIFGITFFILHIITYVIWAKLKDKKNK